MSNFLKKNVGLIIRFDDIAENMNWETFNIIENTLKELDIKPVLGVIPLNKDPELLKYKKIEGNFWDKIRKWNDDGWEIAMHGTHHLYDKFIKTRIDYLNHGGNSEFCGHSLEVQNSKIKKGIEKFRDEKIIIRCFFAPNHTFDMNTLIALRNLGVNQILDGYGIMPYEENKITFIPQLFYKNYVLPFGIQTLQIHSNYFDRNELKKFINFLKLNKREIISYNDALLKINNGKIYKILRNISKNFLKIKRLIF
jgi:predicted deacetylase